MQTISLKLTLIVRKLDKLYASLKYMKIKKNEFKRENFGRIFQDLLTTLLILIYLQDIDDQYLFE